MMRLMRWLIGLWIFVVTIVAFVAAYESSKPPTIHNNSVLMVSLAGPYGETDQIDIESLFTQEPQLSFPEILHLIYRCADDPRFSGLQLKVENQALGMAQLEEFSQAIDAVRSKGKWVHAYLETAGEFAPGTLLYLIASTADEIVMPPSGEVNLVGLQAETIFLPDFLKMLDIETRVLKRKAYKNAGDFLTHRKFTGPHKKALQSLLDDIQGEIIAHITKFRQFESAQEVHKIIAGGPYTAQEAFDKKLLDRLEYWDQVYDRLSKDYTDKQRVSIGTYSMVPPETQPAKTFAYIVAEGQIVRGESDKNPLSSSSVLGSNSLSRAFRSAREDKVDGVLLRVNSPGGSYLASDLVFREINATKEAGIPIVASMGNVAASGGYFLAMGADRVFAAPSTITGSIGVISMFFSLEKLLKGKLKMHVDRVETMPNAGFFQGSTLPNGKRLKKFEKKMDQIYLDFTQKAAKARKMPYEELEKVAQGRVWSGRRAKAVGLVDELGGIRAASKALRELANIAPEEGVRLIDYPPPETPLEALKQIFLGQTRASLFVRKLANAISPYWELGHQNPISASLPPLAPIQ
ncbi:MAG: S49 family peptidase [Myxococcota bacterium]|nr:S49 family peptidase [Myxococcota bacterium]